MRAVKHSILLFCVLGLCPNLLTHCAKDKVAPVVQKIATGTDHPIHAIQCFGTDTCYAVGGDRYKQGLFLWSYDGGQTWYKDSLIDYGCYDLYFFNSKRGAICGFTGKILDTWNGGKGWKVFQERDWEGFLSVTYASREQGYAVGGAGYGFSVFARTKNGGNNWERDTVFDRELRALHFIDDQTGVAAGYGTILRTTDGGQTWKRTNAKDDFFYDLSFPSAQIGYAVGYNGVVLKTTDAGVTWKKVKGGNNVLPERKHYFKIAFWDNLTGYVVGDRGTLHYTNDGGESWQQLDAFTDEDLRAIQLTGKKQGIVSGKEGGMYQFKLP